MRGSKVRESNKFALVGLAALALAGCGFWDQDSDEILVEHHTTCLKRGLAVDTKEHVDCVLALHREKQQRQGQLRDAVEPPPSKAGIAGATQQQTQ